jgi:hypothetical protein
MSGPFSSTCYCSSAPMRSTTIVRGLRLPNYWHTPKLHCAESQSELVTQS